MWEYLAWNLKADVYIFTSMSTETGAVTQRSLYRDLFNQNDMDFYLLQKPGCWWKILILAIGWEDESHTGKSFKVSVERTLIIFDYY